MIDRPQGGVLLRLISGDWVDTPYLSGCCAASRRVDGHRFRPSSAV